MGLCRGMELAEFRSPKKRMWIMRQLGFNGCKNNWIRLFDMRAARTRVRWIKIRRSAANRSLKVFAAGVK